MKKKYISYLIVAASIVFLILVDQLVKIWMVKNLEPGVDYPLIGKYVQLTLVFNQGIAFGFGDVGNSILWGILSLVVSGGVVYIIIKYLDFVKKPLLSIALILILAGALGNMIDRIFNFPACLVSEKGVVDFVNTDFIPKINWGIWNIADALLCVGTAVMVVHIVFFYREPKKQQSTNKGLENTNDDTNVLDPSKEDENQDVLNKENNDGDVND